MMVDRACGIKAPEFLASGYWFLVAGQPPAPYPHQVPLSCFFLHPASPDEDLRPQGVANWESYFYKKFDISTWNIGPDPKVLFRDLTPTLKTLL